MRRALSVVVATVLALPLLGTALPAHAAGCTRNPFTAAFAAGLARAYPGQRVTASVDDLTTGCWYDLAPGMSITTASVVKAGILGTALLQAQDRGRGLSASYQALAAAMIEFSDNNATSALYADTGGTRGMAAFDARVGTTGTVPNAAFGATSTTARDRTLVSRDLLWGGGPLQFPARLAASRYLENVTPTQRWGISAGVPAGYTVALKNGFYPMTGHGWRVGSTGLVAIRGREYAITVMTDQDRTQSLGMGEVEAVSRQVAKTLLPGRPGPRPVDRAVCTQTSGTESWATVTRRLGLPVAYAGAVEHVSGGNPQPLFGQRACSPFLR